MSRLPSWNDDIWVPLYIVAKMTSTCTDTWKRRCQAGVIPSRREGVSHNARYVVRLQDVRHWLEHLPKGKKGKKA